MNTLFYQDAVSEAQLQFGWDSLSPDFLPEEPGSSATQKFLACAEIAYNHPADSIQVFTAKTMAKTELLLAYSYSCRAF